MTNRPLVQSSISTPTKTGSRFIVARQCFLARVVMGAVEHGTAAKDGLRGYYRAKIEEYELAVRDKTSNLRRLEAQRNELNQKGASNPSRAERVTFFGTGLRSERHRSGDRGMASPVRRRARFLRASRTRYRGANPANPGRCARRGRAATALPRRVTDLVCSRSDFEDGHRFMRVVRFSLFTVFALRDPIAAPARRATDPNGRFSSSHHPKIRGAQSALCARRSSTCRSPARTWARW